MMLFLFLYHSVPLREIGGRMGDIAGICCRKLREPVDVYIDDMETNFYYQMRFENFAFTSSYVGPLL